MKRIVLFILFVGYTYAQEDPIKVEIVKDSSFEFADPLGKHELRVNMLDLLVSPALHIYYERVVDASTGYGVSVFADLGDNEVSYQNFSVNPYYRFYFFNRKDYGARGLFVEAFSSLASVNFYDGFFSVEDQDEFQISLGMSVGRKWVNRNGFTFETFLGFGRYLINPSETHEVHGRIGVSIGKRF
ncbi:MAG: hypothetical protein ACPF99_02485 [Flavobacteriaceae bacterium]|jgi:hypothetical protein